MHSTCFLEKDFSTTSLKGLLRFLYWHTYNFCHRERLNQFCGKGRKSDVPQQRPLNSRGLCGMQARSLGHQGTSICLPLKRYMTGKLRSLGRHRREDSGVRQAFILVQRCRFLTTKPFLAHSQLLFCTDLSCRC